MVETSGWIRGLPLVLSFFAFLLGTSGMISYDWLTKGELHETFNPPVQLGETYEFIMYKFGSWLVCYRELGSLVSTCTSISMDCRSQPCWIRTNGLEICGNLPVPLISNCRAFNANRIVLVIGVFLAMLALILHFSWLCSDLLALAFWSGGMGFVSSMLCMSAFVIFQVTLLDQSPGVAEVSQLGWGFHLVQICWIPSLLASLFTLGVGIYYSRPEKPWEGNAGRGGNRYKKRFADEESRFGAGYED